MTHQWCDNHESRIAITFREDSQIDFAKENVILNVSLRPSLPSAFILKLIVSLCVNYLLKITSKIKPRPVGLCYTNGVYRRSGNVISVIDTKLYKPPLQTDSQFISFTKHLYKPIVSLCVNYLLKISKIRPRPVGLCYLYKRHLPAIGNVTLLIDTNFLRS